MTNETHHEGVRKLLIILVALLVLTPVVMVAAAVTSTEAPFQEQAIFTTASTDGDQVSTDPTIESLPDGIYTVQDQLGNGRVVVSSLQENNEDSLVVRAGSYEGLHEGAVFSTMSFQEEETALD